MAIGRVSTNGYATARFIVDTNGISTGATHSTITSALADAVSGQTIAIRPGTYTENLTLKAGVDLVAFEADAMTPNVTIVGKLTATFAGTCSISGIRLQTNSDNLIVVSGSAATIIELSACYLNIANATGISLTSSSSSSKVSLTRCRGDVGTTGISIFANSGNGRIETNYTRITNSGSSTTASTLSGGAGCSAFLYYSYFQTPISTSNANANFTIYDCFFDLGGNTSSITHNSTEAVPSSINGSFIGGGNAAAISIGAGASLSCRDNIISSSNTNAITGSGTLEYGDLIFSGTSSNINVTSQSILSEGPSKTIGSANTGATNTLTVTNSSNTASSNAKIVATVGGTSSADAFYQAVVSGTTTWSFGVDNSDSDAYVLSASATPGTTNVMRVATTGEINYPLQSSFLAYLGSSDANVTGDGTNFVIGSTTALTEVFDQNSDFSTATFTAPVTGRYLFCGNVLTQQVTTAMQSQFNLNTSNNVYPFCNNELSDNGNYTCTFSVIADMDAADTATMSIQFTAGTKVVDCFGGADRRTCLSGQLLA